MDSGKIELNTRWLDAYNAVFDISGEVSSAAENQLTEAYNRATSAGAKRIIFNFTDLEYMNSSGIGLLVTLLIRAQRQNQQLLAFGLDKHYNQIFELTRLNEAIEIYPNELDILGVIEKRKLGDVDAKFSA